MVRLLLDRHAKMDSRDNDGKMPIHYATLMGHTKIVSHFLERAFIDCVDDKGLIPIAVQSLIMI